MKKIFFAILTLSSSLFLANVSLAGENLPPVTVQTVAGAAENQTNANYATDIVITNYSSHYIDAQVPALNVSVRIFPQFAQHIHSYDSNYKRVILSDYNGIIFYDQATPNYFPIDVYDARGKTFVKIAK